MKTLRSDRGQAAVLTVLSLTVLLGMAALVLDVGSWFRAQRDTQAAADASALAAAQALPDEPGTASALAGEYVDKNGGGARTITFASKNVANDTVTVRVERPTPGFFAKVFGVNSVQVGAKATARTGTLDKARFAAPIGVDKRHPLTRVAAAVRASARTPTSSSRRSVQARSASSTSTGRIGGDGHAGHRGVDHGRIRRVHAAGLVRLESRSKDELQRHLCDEREDRRRASLSRSTTERSITVPTSSTKSSVGSASWSPTTSRSGETTG